MKIYLVGGAVRDQLLNQAIKEKDWVVVGATQQEMLTAGYQQVGKDFPVFLHPDTKEEYALARKERKTEKGYHGFEFDVTASVTLEEDLLRRDLTINAIAQDEHGKIIDPHHGVEDIKDKILRHVSHAFVEDPVRILRVARFAARLPNFTVAKETNDLMKTMVDDGEVNALVAERVWKEFEKAMSEVAPWRFIEVLDNGNVLSILFPLFKSKKLEVISCLKKICKMTSDVFYRIVLVMQSTNSLKAIEGLCARYRAPKPVFEMLKLIMEYRPVNTADEILSLFIQLDAFRREDRFKQWLTIGEMNTFSAEAAKYLLSAFNEINKIEIPGDFLAINNGKSIGDFIKAQRLMRLQVFLSQMKNPY